MKEVKTIREIITELNVIRSNNCSPEKSEEIKGVIQELLPYAEVQEAMGSDADLETLTHLGLRKSIRDL